jgi:hypothetical protein
VLQVQTLLRVGVVNVLNLSPRPIRERQRVNASKGTHIRITATQSECMHTTESTHIRDTNTVTHIQRVYASESTHIPDTSTVTQIQSMHCSQCTDIRDTTAVSNIERAYHLYSRIYVNKGGT